MTRPLTIKVVDSGTADQAVVGIDSRMSIRNLTMRTKSGDKLSKESEPCPVNIRSAAANNEDDSESEAELIERLAPGTAGTNLAKPREMLLNYREVQLNFTPEIEVSPVLFERFFTAKWRSLRGL